MITRCPGSFCFVTLYPQTHGYQFVDQDSCASSVHASTFQLLGKRERQRRVHPFLKDTSRVSHTSVLLIAHWLKLSHMTTPKYKGGWEM